jgi:flagellar biosynthesis/type III secretory pathway protein FliH
VVLVVVHVSWSGVTSVVLDMTTARVELPQLSRPTSQVSEKSILTPTRPSPLPPHTRTHTHAMSQQSSLKTSTLVALGVGTVVTGLLAYAVYFDNKRRNDPEFRKALKKESKRTQRAAKEEAEHHGAEQKKLIRDAVAAANEEGFPKDPEEVEAYFMQEVAQGEGMVQKGTIAAFFGLW